MVVSTTRSKRTISLYGHKNLPFLVISLLEIERKELTPINRLKFRLSVLPKLSKKMTYTDFSDIKKWIVSFSVFYYK